MGNRPPPAGVFLILLGAVISIGFSAIFVRWAGAPGPVSGFYRMFLAMLTLATPFSINRRRARRPLSRRAFMLALFGGALFGGDLVFWNSGIMLSGPTTPTVMANMAPIWTGLGAVALFGERPRAAFWIGLATAAAGAVLILGSDALRSFSLGLGTAFGLVAGFFYAAYFLTTQRARESLDAISYFWPASVAATVTLLVVCWILDLPLTGYSTTTYANFLAMAFLVQVGGQFAISYVLGYLPASLVSPIGLLQPVVTALLALFLLGERLTAFHILGGSLILGGVFVVQRSRRAELTAPEPVTVTR